MGATQKDLRKCRVCGALLPSPRYRYCSYNCELLKDKPKYRGTWKILHLANERQKTHDFIRLEPNNYHGLTLSENGFFEAIDNAPNGVYAITEKGKHYLAFLSEYFGTEGDY